jgi:regulator of extracellular matrix RemA (YlzA/DUF370 family)
LPLPTILNVGFNNYVITDKVLAMVSSESAPMRRMIQTLRKDGKVIDATQGRRTRSVIFTSNDGIVLSAISQETLAKRLTGGDNSVGETEEDEE